MKPKEISFMQALLTESTITKAIEKAEISRATAYDYLKDETFRSELQKRQSECINDTVRYLQSSLESCNEELIKIIKNQETPQQIKINAINLVYSTCKSMTDSNIIIERLQRIEEEIERERV